MNRFKLAVLNMYIDNFEFRFIIPTFRSYMYKYFFLNYIQNMHTIHKY